MLKRAEEQERELRRSVGPTAWAVLADLCLGARTDDGDVLVVAASARRVATNVGIGKDAAARTLRRLIAAGVLRRRPQVTDDAGRFDRCIYEIHVAFPHWSPPRPPKPNTALLSDTGTGDTESDPLPVSAMPATGVRHPSLRRRARVANQGHGDQLSLLQPVADTVAEARS